MFSASRRCSFDAFVALAVVVFMCAAPARAAAQVLYGSVVGDVKDSSGAAMPGATVLVTNNNTGFKREAVTDGVGHFNLFDLPAGTYSLKTTQQGFRTFEQTQVTVNINTVTRIDVTMEIGAMGDNVTIPAQLDVRFLEDDTIELRADGKAVAVALPRGPESWTDWGSVPPISFQYIARSATRGPAPVIVVLKSLPASSGIRLA